MKKPTVKSRRVAFASIALSCALLAAAYAGAAETLCLSGSDWRIHEDRLGRATEGGLPLADSSAAGWINASVPGNIQADLEAAHLLAPLWYGAGDPRMADVARKDWWYRKDFTVPASFAGKRVKLIFDGVDHECEVYLNGRKLGGQAGMFKRFAFDVGDVLKSGQVNQLAVKIARIPENLVAVMASSDAPGGSNVGIAVNAVRKQLQELKSPTNCAWDWSVAVYTLGIWKDVRLEATGPARIDWMRVNTDLSDDYHKATVQVGLEVDSLADLAAKITVRAAHEKSAAAKMVEVNLKKGMNQIELDMSLDQPALWWPNGQGDQPLYELNADIAASGTGEILDSRKTRFGVREIRWEQAPGAAADFINPLKLVVNGRPIRQMGSNLIPPDALFGRIDRRGPRLLELARAAGINCLRSWGGGVIFSENMYNRADELGIMLLAEFPLANAFPETDPAFLRNFAATITNIVKQIRNHPCIVEWDGGNEMPWQNGTRHPALQMLEQIVRAEDGRMFRATEPAQGSGGHGTYTYVYHNDPAPQLSWLGAGSQNLYRRYNTSSEMRLSEFGCNSPANLEVWQREIPPSSQWPLRMDDPILIRKNVFYGAYLPQNWLHKEIIESLFGETQDLEQLVRAGQFLGAEGLRYAMDALRRKGKALAGGFMSWDFDEPWPNGAGSYMIDYDGRPLMNYDFVKQALVPVSLTLRYEALTYSVSAGAKAELYLTSDAPLTRTGLQWQWLARDRRGTDFARDKGTVASIDPQEVIRLAALDLRPPAETAFGPFFVELKLSDSSGNLLGERLHVFGARESKSPLAGLLKSRGADNESDQRLSAGFDLPNGPRNLAYVGNGAKPATASSSRPEPIHQPAGLNDGIYGNDHSWIGLTPKSSFQIDLGKVAEMGRFKIGRDRSGAYADRLLDYIKIEASGDGNAWQTVFEKQGIANPPPGRKASATMEIRTPPVRARFVRVTVGSGSATGEGACVDEFEIYAPEGESEGPLPRVTFSDGRLDVFRPVTRTTLRVSAAPLRVEGDREVIELVVTNMGKMTALFCEPHPLIEYRTDLFIDNNHCFIPPGESRTITIRASAHPAGGLNLAETGWRLSTWNADDCLIEPSGDVLLAVGRRDQMCREFAGYSDPNSLADGGTVELSGRLPDASTLPCLLRGKSVARFRFSVSAAQAAGRGRLRLHTADQSNTQETSLAISINGRSFSAALPKGLDIQNHQPAHLAFPATASIEVPAGAFKAGENSLQIQVANGGWFTWDALDLIGDK